VDLQKAQQDFADGQYAICAARLQSRAARLGPAALRLRSACSFLTGQYALTSESATLLCRSLPADPEGLYWSIRSGEKLALAALDRFAVLAPDSVRTHLLLGDIDRQRQLYEDAIVEYTHSLSMEPNNYAALQGLASAYLLDGKLGDAATAAKKALAQRPDDPELNIVMGETLIGEHDYEDAESYLKKTLIGKPQLVAQAHALLGRVYASMDRNQEAFTELKLGLSTDDDGSLHYLLGRIYRSQGDNLNASLAFKQAKELSGNRLHRATIAMEDLVGLEDSSPQ
jgi:anaphase-promoting complex subunit 3